MRCTEFVPKATHGPISAHLSYFEGINHNIHVINHRPSTIYQAQIHSENLTYQVYYDSGHLLAWKGPKSSILEAILATIIEINKHSPKMIYLSGTPWALIGMYMTYMNIKYWNSNMNLNLIKDAQSYFSKLSFLLHLKNHYSKDVNSKIQLKRSSRLDVRSNLYIAGACILLCKLNYGYHNQTRFH